MISEEKLKSIVKAGESETVEFKKSTGQLPRAGETLCGMLNGKGDYVFVGITPKGDIVGQQVSDSTLRDIATMLGEFEPPAPIQLYRVSVTPEREVLVFSADKVQDVVPFTFKGRFYQRIESTTSIMPQDRYQTLLLERIHSKKRWENESADYSVNDLDQEEILRTVRLAIESGRLSEQTEKNMGDILNRLGLRHDNKLFNAAIVLFGTRFVPKYIQCQLRMARFRGINKSEFLDQRPNQWSCFLSSQ